MVVIGNGQEMNKTVICKSEAAKLPSYLIDELQSSDPYLMGVRLQAGRGHGSSWGFLTRRVNAGYTQKQQNASIQPSAFHLPAPISLYEQEKQSTSCYILECFHHKYEQQGWKPE